MKIKDLKISHRLVIGFGIVILIMVAVGVVAYAGRFNRADVSASAERE